MLMRRSDELHLNYPFAGSRMLCGMLSQQGLEVGRRHVRTLMRRMGIEALIASRTRRNPVRATRSIPICCAASRSRGPIKPGPWISATFP